MAKAGKIQPRKTFKYPPNKRVSPLKESSSVKELKMVPYTSEEKAQMEAIVRTTPKKEWKSHIKKFCESGSRTYSAVYQALERISAKENREQRESKLSINTVSHTPSEVTTFPMVKIKNYSEEQNLELNRILRLPRNQWRPNIQKFAEKYGRLYKPVYQTLNARAKVNMELDMGIEPAKQYTRKNHKSPLDKRANLEISQTELRFPVKNISLVKTGMGWDFIVHLA